MTSLDWIRQLELERFLGCEASCMSLHLVSLCRMHAAPDAIFSGAAVQPCVITGSQRM